MPKYTPPRNTMNVYRSSQFNTNTINTKKSKRDRSKFVWLCLIFLIVGGVIYGIKGSAKTITYNKSQANQMAQTAAKTPTRVASACQGNTESEEVVVKISLRHLYACHYQTVAYSSAVVTGYIGNPADVTPLGKYTVFTKETNVTLTGSDGTSSWNDPVHFWMPFLFNKYGAYGFHDAPWRTPSQFGNISDTLTNASHGCIECPYATAKFLYNWVQKGTVVNIIS